MKQETLEEAAEKDYQKQTNYDKAYNRKLGFKEGAKWQAERSYSEEEVLPIIEYIQWVIRKIDAGNTPEEIIRLLLINRDKIEQFKKK